MKNKFSKVQKKRLASVICGSALFLTGIIFNVSGISLVSDFAFIAAGISSGIMCVTRAFRGIMNKNFFDENTLMTIAAAGALLIGEYPECAAVMILYQVGELFQSLAVGKSRKAIGELSKLCPDTATVLRDGSFTEVEATTVLKDEIIRIAAGERIPVDCVICDGDTFIDTSPVTGESVPRKAQVGDNIYSGCMNLNGLIRARVIRPANDSAAARILKLTEEASDRKTASETFITRFAKIYTPIVCLLAALTAFLVPLVIQLTGGSFLDAFPVWSEKALSMLVISCPCALVISVPLGYFCGLGKASSNGILIKGSAFIDTLAKADCAMFDKTGTITKGQLSVSDVAIADDFTRERLLLLAASSESTSSHPIAKAICAAVKEPLIEVSTLEELAGKGVEATLCDGTRVSVLRPEAELAGTAVTVTVNGKKAGDIYFRDEIKPGSADAICQLRHLGIKETVILTGDTAAEAERIKEAVGADTVYSRLLPENKLTHIEKACENRTVIFAGDGINDSPSLARADAGIAMGALGSEAAIEAADIVLMDSNLMRLVTAIKISRRTLFSVRINIILSLSVKILVLILSILGFVGMWSAVLADVGICIICVSNSMSILRMKNK